MSDSNTRRRAGIVVGTAGHIDHGKTSLVRALTGVDTDRLAEEKRRGISIDLGFAHFPVADGVNISFVDVPGHERFIRNMLAGAAGIEAVLLVIAANEGVKPQTREHFEICRLLGIGRGLIALTKCDLVSENELAAARAAVQELVAGSFLENAPVIAVSAATGTGLDELRNALEALAQESRGPYGGRMPRLPIDRSFALKGFGTIVTGTLAGDKLRAGETVTIHPLGLAARVRGLQVHGESVPEAFPGERTAVNLSGIEHSILRRGFVLTPGQLADTHRLQGSLTLLRGFEIEPREEFLFHSGTAEIPARLRVLSSGEQPFVEIFLAETTLALPGDRFVLRRPSPPETIGGGEVVDAFPPRRLNRRRAAARLMRLANADLPTRVTLLVEEKETGRKISDLARLMGETSETIANAVARAPELVLAEGAQQVLTKNWLEEKRGRVLAALSEFHRQHPSAAGAPLAQFRFGLQPALANAVFSGLAGVRISGDTIALASHQAQLSPAELAELARIEQQFRAAAYQPPAPAQFARAPLERLIKSGKLVRITPELIFHADVIAHIRRSLAAHKGRRFSVPEFKDWIHISRKYAIPLLEFLDHQHVTRREGDLRVIL